MSCLDGCIPFNFVAEIVHVDRPEIPIQTLVQIGVGASEAIDVDRFPQVAFDSMYFLGIVAFGATGPLTQQTHLNLLLNLITAVTCLFELP